MLKYVFTFFIYAVAFPAQADQTLEKLQCHVDKERQQARATELQQLVTADQEDRENFFANSPDKLLAISERDLARRKRVGEIFGEGCFVTAKDFAAAALIFQHGNTSDQFYQAIIWANRAIELGDLSQKYLMADAMDRYLIKIGKKQLFATQAYVKDMQSCWCLQQTEKSFPDELRKNYTGKTYADALQWANSFNKAKQCPIQECNTALRPTPKGSVIGFW